MGGFLRFLGWILIGLAIAGFYFREFEPREFRQWEQIAEDSFDISLTASEMTDLLATMLSVGVGLIVVGQFFRMIGRFTGSPTALGAGLHPDNPLPKSDLLSGRHDHGRMDNIGHGLTTASRSQMQQTSQNSGSFPRLMSLLRVDPNLVKDQIETAYREGKLDSDQYQRLQGMMRK